MNRFFIIGNGFDLLHKLPTHFDPDFKNIAESLEKRQDFWQIYQSKNANIWADFENSLAHPDFKALEEIFYGFEPDYLSDHERDRNAIITEVDLNGNLTLALNTFANQAECSLEKAFPIPVYSKLFKQNDLFMSFNYTHTLEKVYGIQTKRVLHIHGEVGKNNLILGYPDGSFEPEQYSYDVRQKGRGPYVDIDIQNYIKDLSKRDFYIGEAYRSLLEKTKSFKKEPQLHIMEQFLNDIDINEVYVLGHSCNIDFSYFEWLNKKYPNLNWFFTAHNKKTENSIKNMTTSIGIINYQIIT